MLVVWRANFGGTREQLEMVKEKLKEIAQEDGDRVEGPYCARDADLIWLFWATSIGLGGRKFLP